VAFGDNKRESDIRVPQRFSVLGNIYVVLILLFLLIPSLALAASPPAITVPAGQFIVPGSAVTISGTSITESGAGPTVQFTTTLTAIGTLTATGTGVSGSGTSSLTIAGTSAQTNTALTTLAINETCAVPAQCTDAITINTHDASNNTAPQQQIPIVADGNKYLTFGTLAAAQARSAAQMSALCSAPCGASDLARTTYWWNVVVTSTGAAVQILPGDACRDAVIAAACGITKSHPGATAVTGLTPTEQTQLVTAPNAGFTAPIISGGAVVP
jgi:hypothetical protein